CLFSSLRDEIRHPVTGRDTPPEKGQPGPRRRSAAMRRRSSMSGISMAAATAVALAAAAPAGAGTLYRWQTENGTLAFADDPKRIPERYREGAEEIHTEGLDDYERFTPTDSAAQQAHEARLAERLDGLRAESG